MNQTDLIILAVYLLSVTYIIYQAIISLEAQTVFRFDQTALAAYLSQSKIGDVPLSSFVDINFSFKPRYKFSEQPTALSAVIVNKSPSATLNIDWDSSSITNHAGKVRRAIRLTPNLQPSDLNDRQVVSTIPPSRSLAAVIAPEDALKPDPEKGTLVPNGAIVDLSDVFKNKPLQAQFEEREASLQFTLRLLLQIVNIADGAKRDYWSFVPCTFYIDRIPFTDYIPWNPTS